MAAEKERRARTFVIWMFITSILVLGFAFNVVANEPPMADADPDVQTVNAGEEVYFTGSGSHDRDGYIVSYTWIFGDGLVYHGENISYTFKSPGDYTVTLTVEDDFGNTDSDSVMVHVLEGTPPSEDTTVWIASLTTDKVEYDIKDTVEIAVVVERGCDLLMYVWEGTLLLEILDSSSVMVFSEDAPVYLASGGDKENHNFEYTLTEEGDYLIMATLFDAHGNQVDQMETSIRACDGPPGGDDPPDDEDKMVWIESLTTDKDGYIIDETIRTQVVVERGEDMLTYVWEGLLVLEVYNEERILVHSDSGPVSLPGGGMKQTLDFEYSLTEAGEYTVIAVLYDFAGEQIDMKRICLKIDEDSPGENGTPASEEKPPLSKDNNRGIFTGHKGGIFKSEEALEMGILAFVSIGLLVISSYAILRRYKSSDKKIKKI